MRRLQLSSRKVVHGENGSRAVPVNVTAARLERFLVRSTLDVAVQHQPLPFPPGHRCVLQVLTPAAFGRPRTFVGKGLTEEQSLASAGMELVERLCAVRRGDEPVVRATLADLGARAVDPRRFVLPDASRFRPDLTIEWVQGFRLPDGAPRLVPANLVFCPYHVADRSAVVAGYDSNGLASGNCLEEAILHGLLEVVERDVAAIAHYHRLPGRDVRGPAGPDDGVSRLLRALRRAGVEWTVKELPTDLGVPTLGVWLAGPSGAARASSHAVGTHLSARVALSRAVTEAVQLFPRAANFRAWRRSGPLDYLHGPGGGHVPWRALPELASGDLRRDVERLVGAVGRAGAEVYVVDLSRSWTGFRAVRVLATALQPIVVPGGLRLAPRFFEVPVRLGLRRRAVPRRRVRPRALCGHALHRRSPIA